MEPFFDTISMHGRMHHDVQMRNHASPPLGYMGAIIMAITAEQIATKQWVDLVCCKKINY